MKAATTATAAARAKINSLRVMSAPFECGCAIVRPGRWHDLGATLEAFDGHGATGGAVPSRRRPALRSSGHRQPLAHQLLSALAPSLVSVRATARPAEAGRREQTTRRFP